MNKKDPELLKIADAARLLGVNRRTIYRRIWNGDLPASKVGGLYFIRRTDLDKLLIRGRTAPPSKEGEALQPGVNARAGAPVAVRASEARSREIEFIQRIQFRVEQIESLIHPQSGDVLNLTGLPERRVLGDERARIMQLMGTMILDKETAARVPLNAWVRWDIPESRGQEEPGVCIQAQALSRLEIMLRDGLDPLPLGAAELAASLRELENAAERDRVTALVVLASTTGWDAPARALIRGEQPGRVRLDHLLVYLLDIPSGELVYHSQDPSLAGYAKLFAPESADGLAL